MHDSFRLVALACLDVASVAHEAVGEVWLGVHDVCAGFYGLRDEDLPRDVDELGGGLRCRKAMVERLRE